VADGKFSSSDLKSSQPNFLDHIFVFKEETNIFRFASQRIGFLAAEFLVLIPQILIPTG
jgi:hypothetical protein